MDALEIAKQKLEHILDIMKNSPECTAQSIKKILGALDEGLQFSKDNYSELNSIALNRSHKLKGSDIYFFCTRYTYQFYMLINMVQTVGSGSYYEKVINYLQIRQQRFDELRKEAQTKINEILGKTFKN